MMMDSEEEEEQTALVCDNGEFRDSTFIIYGPYIIIWPIDYGENFPLWYSQTSYRWTLYECNF